MENKFKEGDVVYYHEMSAWTGVPTEHDGALLVVEEVRNGVMAEGTSYLCRALNYDEITGEFDQDGFMAGYRQARVSDIVSWIAKAYTPGIIPACDLPNVTGFPLKAPQDTLGLSVQKLGRVLRNIDCEALEADGTLSRLRASVGKPKVDLMEGFDDPCKTNQRSFEIQHCINGLKGLPAMSNGVDTLTINKAIGYLEGMLK